MTSSSDIEVLNSFKSLIESGKYEQAQEKFTAIKNILLTYDSLPPLNMESPNAFKERLFARDALEYVAIMFVGLGDKLGFERHMNALKAYYTKTFDLPESPMTPTVLGLNLLYLLVENRLADFHSELELLKDSHLEHPHIAFCTQLDRHLVVGSYDQVLNAAAKPPVSFYSFFLNFLLETVRLNIGDCMAASYEKLSLQAATKILMFSNIQETRAFIEATHGDWVIENDTILLRVNKSMKSESLPALKLISQTLTYATELERIV